MTFTDEEIYRRIELASKATPGPWTTFGEALFISIKEPGFGRVDDGWDQSFTDAAHIAASDPTTLTAVYEELLVLRAEVARLKTPRSPYLDDPR